MKSRFGIMIKLFLWYCILISIAYGTILVFFTSIQQMMKVSDNIVNRKYRISSNFKRMLDSLLYMEENEKKYGVLKKTEYIEYFVSAQKEFEGSLLEILQLETATDDAANPWRQLYQDYRAQFPESLFNAQGDEGSQVPWIPEEIINDWIQKISAARSENEREVVAAMVILHRRGQLAVQWGLVGLSVTILVALAGVVFLPIQSIDPFVNCVKASGPFPAGPEGTHSDPVPGRIR